MELVAIGRILKPIGRRGALKVAPLTDMPERFQKLQRVWIGTSVENAQESNVVSVEMMAQYVALTVDTIRSFEDAESRRRAYVFVPFEERIVLTEGSYFIDAIIGCVVYDEANNALGTVSDVLSMPAHDVWVVTTQTKEILLPAVKSFIRSIDVDAKRIVIHVVEGLLE